MATCFYELSLSLCSTNLQFLRYFLELSYNGSAYHGWQKQPNAVSVQEVIEKALHDLLSEEIALTGCGRTDTGVHAEQYFAHFDSASDLRGSNLLYRLNAYLPKDLAVKGLFEVENLAHARFDALSRTYEYRISLIKDPFTTKTTLQMPYQKIDVSLMNEAAMELLKHSNFKCFSRVGTDVKTFDCIISEAGWAQKNEVLVFTVTANRFLRNMVRAMVGTLLEIGMHKRPVDDMKRVIQSQSRENAGASVKAHGLFLTRISYPYKLENITG